MKAGRARVREAFDGLVDDADEADLLRSGLGLDFDFRTRGEGLFEVDSRDLAKTLSRSPGELESFLFDTQSADGRDGLIPALEEALESIGATLATRLARGK